MPKKAVFLWALVQEIFGMKEIFLVGLGGGAGSMLRYLVKLSSAKLFSTSFPLATFSANILGCLAIGLLMGYLNRNLSLPESYSLLLITGFCGGFTTFSTFSAENLQLIQSGQWATALAYILGSVVLGLGAVFLGILLMK